MQHRGALTCVGKRMLEFGLAVLNTASIIAHTPSTETQYHGRGSKLPRPAYGGETSKARSETFGVRGNHHRFDSWKVPLTRPVSLRFAGRPLAASGARCRGIRGTRCRQLPPLLCPAQQEHALLAEHVPEPPGRDQPQRPAVKIERDRALHLDVDLVAELHEILDGTEMDVRRVVPGRRQILGARHMAADQ